jgi:RNA polymerase sigma factor (sigma-70 family)
MIAVTDQGTAFVTTQWTRVLQARGNSPEAQAALSDLCAAYYAPVLAFVRFTTRDDDVARDLTQEFFARLLARHGLDTVERERGRFRSFLLGAVKHFLADARDREQALKRGGGQAPVPLEGGMDAAAVLEIADANAISPDQEFDRKWALTVLDHALSALAAEHKDQTKQFDTLKPWLTGDSEHLRQVDAAKELGISEGAVKVAIHRLRRRFRDLVKSEVAQTLHDPAQVKDELACLMAAIH